ncbi:uncharacterized protein LOC123662199 [Melitaea cinxia]|uniref:uncharacterized protein LOC123662199 n=1 Tax=Melitaea cinxia TaxID=113334 RepID=UPI001E274C62|nr:uncharacterized protein LOC123662199 [Melitaea cinxia]
MLIPVLSCSTPEHHSAISSIDSPSRDSDSDAASPVPFLCTQDGAEGETDVVWNFYTPKSGATKYNVKITTPVRRRARKSERLKNIEKEETKRRTVKPSQKKYELFQELIELNHDLNKIINKNATITVEKPQSEEDIFSDGSDSSPRSGLKSKNRCLRKNVLSSKFLKPESESGLESDDSMNEFLLKASQAVEENILNRVQVDPKRPCFEPVDKSVKSSLHVINQDSMDAILNNIKMESPNIAKIKRCETPKLNNDSFDNLLGDLNDSTIESLSQYPVQTDFAADRNNVNQSKKDLKISIESPSSKIFSRHNSMPESPSVNNGDKPSTSGMAFSRYSSMPFNKSNEKIGLGDSPIRCTPEEIRKKHQQAREKLLAKRTLPFTPAQQIIPTKPTQAAQKFVPKKPFQPKVPTAPIVTNNVDTMKITESIKKISADQDIKQLIEKKRQEALMKLRRRHTQKKC